jgi:hypothetical protein
VLMNMFGSGLDDKNGNNGFDTDKLWGLYRHVTLAR